MRWQWHKGPVDVRAEAAQGIEEKLIGVVMQRLRPALEALFGDLKQQVETLVGAAVERELAASPRLRRIGEVKHCSGCGLPGSRNFAGLAKGHSQEEHRRLQHARQAQRPTAASRARARAAARVKSGDTATRVDAATRADAAVRPGVSGGAGVAG